MSSPGLPPELRARVLQAIAAEPVAPRGRRVWRRVWPLVLGFGFLLLSLRSTNFGGRPPGFVWVVALLWVPLAVAATWVSVGRGRSMLGRPAPLLLAVTALTPLAMMALWVWLARLWPVPYETTSTLHNHVVCDVVALILSAGPLLALGSLRRGSDPVRPRLTGAAIGVAAAAWAAVVHHFLCVLASPWHVFVGHVAPVLAVALAGALLTGRTVAVRAKTG